jgi:sugar transferase (PEP-CTERM/EpsH1 system associated)
MKILWVKAGGLVPPDTGGKIRSYNILRELARHHAVTFFSFYAALEKDGHPGLESVFDRVLCLPLELPAARSLAELKEYGSQLFSREPYNITKYCRPQVARELRRLLEAEPFDVIICDFLIAAGAIPWDMPTPKVLFTHNVEALIWKRHYEVARNPLWKLLCWREWRTMTRAEHGYLEKADHVLAVSDADRDVFTRFLDPAKVTVVPTGVDVEYFRPGEQKEKPNSLVFTGSMDWMPNEDGIGYFAEEVLPEIRREIPAASLCVVGRKPSKRMQTLAARHNFQLTGWVEDIRSYLAEGAVCVVPLRVGSGTRLKIFEAMSMAKAVVSTTIGAEGLPVQHGENIVLADENRDFARAVVELLRDPTRRQRLGTAARTLVETKYSWASVAQDFADVLARVLAVSPKSTLVSRARAR